MTTFDAISLEVLWTRVISIVDEAAKAIVRTSDRKSTRLNSSH